MSTNLYNQKHMIDFLKSIRPIKPVTQTTGYLFEGDDLKRIHSVTNYMFEDFDRGRCCQLVSIQPDDHYKTILDWIIKFDMEFCQFAVSCSKPRSLSLFCSKKGSEQLQTPIKQISFLKPITHHKTIRRVFDYFDRGVRFSFSNEVIKHNIGCSWIKTKNIVYMSFDQLKKDSDGFYRFRRSIDSSKDHLKELQKFRHLCNVCGRYSTIHQAQEIQVELCHPEPQDCKCCFLSVCGVRHVHFFDGPNTGILLVDEIDLKSKFITL